MVTLLPIIMIILRIILILGRHFFLVLPRLLILRRAMALHLIISGAAWLGLAILMIYVGGIIVLFSYFLTLSPSQPILWKSWLLILPTLVVNYSDLKTTNIIGQPYWLINHFLTALFIFSVLWLFYAIVVVVKLSLYNQGPLRTYG